MLLQRQACAQKGDPEYQIGARFKNLMGRQVKEVTRKDIENDKKNQQGKAEHDNAFFNQGQCIVQSLDDSRHSVIILPE